MNEEMEKFTKALTAIGCEFVITGAGIEVTDGFVDLPRLTSMPEGITFNNCGGVDLQGLTSMPEGIAFNNGGGVYLRSLTSMPEGITFNNGGYVDLPSLTSMPEGITFNNGGGVYLRSLTSMPEGITFNNGGYVDLPSLPDGEYQYLGQTVTLAQIDGLTMLVGSVRKRGEVKVMSCRYFGGGDLKRLKAYFVAQYGEYSAHGATVEKAIRDVRFKVMQADLDPDELIATIKKRGTVTFNDFRLLTGACESGLSHGLEQAGLKGDTEELTITEAIKAAHGPYGAQFKRMMEVAQ